MTNEELINHYNRMVEIWGDNLPNIDQEPIRFAYYVKLYRMYYVQTT